MYLGLSFILKEGAAVHGRRLERTIVRLHFSCTKALPALTAKPFTPFHKLCKQPTLSFIYVIEQVVIDTFLEFISDEGARKVVVIVT
jgi:hypothetical protein